MTPSEPGGTARLFIAVSLPERTCDRLVAAQTALQALARAEKLRVRWSRPEQLHVTSKFLGEVERGAIAPLAAQIRVRAREAGRVEGTLEAIDCFGPRKRARVLIVRVADSSGALAWLAERFDRDASVFGVDREPRSYRPHVTLGRFKPPASVAPLLRAGVWSPEPVTFPELRLYESSLAERGSHYAVLASAPLGV